MTQRSFHRRAFIAAAFVLPLGACSQSSLNNPFARSNPFAAKPFTLSARGDRMVRWLHNEGADIMMAPEAFAVMGLNNGGRDIPVKQLALDGTDGRYVVSLVNIRQIHEFVLHRRQGEVLTFHHCDTNFTRLTSVRYARNGKPTFITDNALAENDFQQQLAFWFERMPGR